MIITSIKRKTTFVPQVSALDRFHRRKFIENCSYIQRMEKEAVAMTDEVCHWKIIAMVNWQENRPIVFGGLRAYQKFFLVILTSIQFNSQNCIPLPFFDKVYNFVIALMFSIKSFFNFIAYIFCTVVRHLLDYMDSNDR